MTSPTGLVWTPRCDRAHVMMDPPTFLERVTSFLHHYPAGSVPELDDGVLELSRRCQLLRAACEIWSDSKPLMQFGMEKAWSRIFQVRSCLFRPLLC